MFFGILVTPKEFLIGVLLITIPGFFILMSLIFGTPPSRLDGFPERIEAITQEYEEVTADIEQKTKIAESAVLKTHVSTLKIAKDRLNATVKATIENISEHPAIGAQVEMEIHSKTLSNCIGKISWTKRFKPPLQPGASTDIQIEWRVVNILGLRSKVRDQQPPCDADAINKLIGSHEISKVEALVSHYLIKNPRRDWQELSHLLGPTAKDYERQLNAKNKLDECAPVIALIDENNFTEDDIENHSFCFNSIGLTPNGVFTPGSLRE